jgi:hypothetical protein
MIKSAMRHALKESLFTMKKNLRNERAKSHIKDDGEADDGDSEGPPSGSAKNLSGLAKTHPGLSSKVGEAESEGMRELEAHHPSAEEQEGTPEHEAAESPADKMAEGEGSAEDWREDQKNFMKGRSKPSGKKTAFAIAVLSPEKSGKKGGKFGRKG